MRNFMISAFSLLALIHFASRWYYSRDIDVREGECLSDRWLCWGSIRRWADDDRRGRYFLLRFPSWDWGYHCSWDRYGWLQRALLMTDGRWRLIQLESSRA